MNILTRILAAGAATLMAVTALTSAAPGDAARMTRGWTAKALPTPSGTAPMALTVDSIMYRDDVVRLYGSISGRPNSSACINAMILRDNRTSQAAVDTDGFDLERRFQWEEDGVIPVEIDFAPARHVQPLTLDIITDRGTYSWILIPRRSGRHGLGGIVR